MALETLFNQTITLARNGDVDFKIQAKHNALPGFSGSNPWAMYLFFDGVGLKTVSGAGAFTELPVIIAARLGVSGGDHNVQVLWYGTSYMQITAIDLVIDARYR